MNDKSISQSAANEISRERLLVLISIQNDHEYLVRRGRQIAESRRVEWVVLWVDTGQPIMREDKARLQSSLSLAMEFGARVEVLRSVDALPGVIHYINIHDFNIVLLGSGGGGFIYSWRKRLYQKLIDSGLTPEVIVCTPPKTGRKIQHAQAIVRHYFSGSLLDHMYAIFSAIIATGFAILLAQWLSSGNLVLIYVLAVIIVGLRHGAGPAMTTVALAFLSFDFFLAQPIFGFFPNQQDDIAAMVFLVVIALLCGPAASHLRSQFISLNESNRYTDALRALGQRLTVADTEHSVWLILADELGRVLQTEVTVVSFEGARDQNLNPDSQVQFNPLDWQAIQWSKLHAKVAGRFTDTFDTTAWSFFPVISEGRAIVITAIRFGEDATSLKPYDRDLIAAMLQQSADAWQRIQLTAKLESAHLKSEVEQLRSALLSSVSHDLKSPLAAMIGAAETLNIRDIQLESADRQELSETILQESRRLESYIQNLLDMTRLGHGTLQISRDWVSVDDIIGAALARLKRYFPTILTEYQNDEPAPLLYAQAVLIEQAVYNILENAAKFTPPGKKISIWVEQQINSCLINIEDQGPGIPESLREKIFDMFYAVADGDHKKQNTGMGLAICRGMITAHGGRVSAHAGSGNTGTRFIIELPLDRPLSPELS